MKNKIYSLVMVLFSNIPIFGQAPNYLWAKSAGGMGYDAVSSVAVDDFGNTYIAGSFNSPTLVFGTTTLTNANGGLSLTYDIFLAKYDASGNVLWAKSVGGTDQEFAYSLAVDASGNSCITGYFSSSTVTFGSTTLTVTGMRDAYLAKYDASGNVLWAIGSAGTTYDYGSSVAMDASGDIYIAGCFTSSTITFGSTILPNAGQEDLFLVKYDASGNVLWAKSSGSTAFDYASSVATDVSGNVYITGYFNSPSLNFGSYTLTNGGGLDILLAKYDASGNVIWAKSAGGSNVNRATSIAVNATGNVYITGSFDSPTLTFGSTTLTNLGYYDIFLVKYDTSGNVLWAEGVGGTSNDYATSVAIDASGNVYITGSFISPTLPFGSTTLTNGGGSDIFLAAYDASGNALWSKSAIGGANEDSYSVAVDISGNTYITGYFSNFTITFGSTTLSPANSADIFLAKLGNTAGLDELNNVFNISIFPNPFSTQVTLQTDIPLTNATLTVDNCFGQTVAQIKNISGQTITFNRGNLTSGLYFVRLTEENKTIAIDKLVITAK